MWNGLISGRSGSLVPSPTSCTHSRRERRRMMKQHGMKNLKTSSSDLSRGTRALTMGNKAEKSCVLALKRKYPTVVTNNSIFVHHLYHWFAYSCDGYIQERRVFLEIKSPVIGKNMAAEEFNEKNCKFLTLCGENLRLRKRHKFYGQIQLGLFLLGLNVGRLIVYPKFSDTFLEITVPYDEVFREHFIPTLANLYFTKYIQFLSEKSRHT